MVSELFENWSPEEAELIKSDMNQSGYPTVNVEEAVNKAVNSLEIEYPEGPGYVIPLFEENEPITTKEYVIYRPERGQLIWYDTKTSHGTQRFTSCSEFKNHEIGYRLRFWISNTKTKFEKSELPDDKILPNDQLYPSEKTQFFDDLENFVKSEMKTQLGSNWDNYKKLGLEESIRQNKISGPFAFSGSSTTKSGNQSYSYQILMDDDEEIDLRDDEGIFEGNRCIVDTKATTDVFPIAAKITTVDDPKISLQPIWKHIDDTGSVEKVLKNKNSEVWISYLLNPVPFKRRLTALQEIKKNTAKRKLLTGERAIEFNLNKYDTPNPDLELNDYQQKALVWADSADDIVCIHGPPGTGKTRTLTAYVQHAVSQNNSVLVTAHSNQAVDNLIVGDSTIGSPEEDTLHALAQKEDSQLSIARVGNNSKSQVVTNYYANQSVSNANVVAATTSGAAQFNQNQFDIAVVDEATQVSRPATAIALNSAKKLILAGDHKQLPPYCADETMQEEDMHISLFEYLFERYGTDISILLQKQYRMNQEIAAFPNKAFYSGSLETADRCRNWTVGDLKPNIGIDIDGDEERQTHGNSIYNDREAEAVAKQVKRLVQTGLAPSDIGVITAYSGQVGRIITYVNQLDIGNPRHVEIDTVDSFQGGEREAIVVSFVRSNSDGYSGFLEFPEEGPRRLNVALTRARKRLVLIGNWDTLGRIAPHRSPEDSCAQLYAGLAEHLRKNDRMLSIKTTQ